MNQNDKLPPFVLGEFWAERMLEKGANPWALFQAGRKHPRNPFWEGVRWHALSAAQATALF